MYSSFSFASVTTLKVCAQNVARGGVTIEDGMGTRKVPPIVVVRERMSNDSAPAAAEELPWPHVTPTNLEFLKNRSRIGRIEVKNKLEANGLSVDHPVEPVFSFNRGFKLEIMRDFGGNFVWFVNFVIFVSNFPELVYLNGLPGNLSFVGATPIRMIGHDSLRGVFDQALNQHDGGDGVAAIHKLALDMELEAYIWSPDRGYSAPTDSQQFNFDGITTLESDPKRWFFTVQTFDKPRFQPVIRAILDYTQRLEAPINFESSYFEVPETPGQIQAASRKIRSVLMRLGLEPRSFSGFLPPGWSTHWPEASQGFQGADVSPDRLFDIYSR